MTGKAYLSLGSNLGDRLAHLRKAIHLLGEAGAVRAVSGFYETEPVEVKQEQPWFLNCAVQLDTELTPEQLLSRALAIELRMGRRRVEKKGPRTIDIDIILFEQSVIETPDLTIPHPAMQNRRFVLQPLAEIAPEMVHPVLKRTVRELLAALPPGSGATQIYREDAANSRE